MLVKNKYAVAFLTLIGAVVSAFMQANLDNVVTDQEIWGIVSLFGGAVTAIFLPLAKGGWIAGVKVGGAVIVAAAGNVIGVIVVSGSFGREFYIGLVFVILQAVLVQLGVWQRADAVAAAAADPNISAESLIAADAPAVAALNPLIVEREGLVDAVVTAHVDGLAD